LRSSTRRGGAGGVACPARPVWPVGGVSDGRRRTAAATTSTTAATGGGRVDRVRDPTRVRGERGSRGVRDFDVLIVVEPKDVQDRLGVGGRGVRERQHVSHPLAVAGERRPVDTAPPRVVVDGEDLFRGGLRDGRRSGQDREHDGKRREGREILRDLLV